MSIEIEGPQGYEYQYFFLQHCGEPVTSLWFACKFFCGRAIIACGLAINNPVVSEVKSEISFLPLFPSIF